MKTNNQSKLVYSNNKKSIFINFLERKLIPTGLILCNLDKKIFLFLKKTFIKSICIIHIESNKEIKIIVINTFWKKKPLIIKPNEKLAIISIIYNIKNVYWNNTFILKKSIRGNKSFGSTGI
ncbi:dCTP deaminase/dUTPase family protein [Blattabacterium cuenoti]|uniref:dUTP diphosphatase n=1 Tax=Blattabacterium cuenoti TaxID=1653831 RepID=UPI00163C82CC|nr:dUTP diphosphatase [Blattabacterium cuenoti]